MVLRKYVLGRETMVNRDGTKLFRLVAGVTFEHETLGTITKGTIGEYG